MITILGAFGLIGRALARRASVEGNVVQAIGRGDPIPAQLGHVYFCAGLTSDFRQRPHDAIEAHVTLASSVLRRTDLDSFTYLSSTRVYMHSSGGREDSAIMVDPQQPSDLYNLSKLTGEALCLNDPRPALRVVRLSNVLGAGDTSTNFLSAVVGEAASTGRVTIGSGRGASKDYIALDDAVEAIFKMPFHASSRLINVASGENITNQRVGDLLQLRGIAVSYGEGAPGPVFPPIDNQRMRTELGIVPARFDESFAAYLATMP